MPDVPLLHWDGARELGAAVAVTTRHGGVSAGPYATLNLGLHVGDDPACVLSNRRRTAAAFGIACEDMVFARQVHGATAAVVERADRGRGIMSDADALADIDALVTVEPGLALVVMVADCVPIALVDPAAGVLAVVHAGWRGTGQRVVDGAVAAMRRLGAQPDRMTAYLGPAVAPDRYQVDDRVRDALARAVAPDPLPSEVARPDGPGRWLVDLVAANRQQLLGHGVQPSRIFDSGRTTSDPKLFSDRAARPCGRFALLARLLA